MEETDTHLVALMKENRGAWSESTMDLASQILRLWRASWGIRFRRRKARRIQLRAMRIWRRGCKIM